MREERMGFWMIRGGKFLVEIEKFKKIIKVADITLE